MNNSDLQTYLQALSSLIQPVRGTEFPRPLEPMQRLLAALNHPERAFESMVVAGSVGKGTACLQIARTISRTTIGPVGLYTGPHLHSFRERFEVDGTPISLAEFIAGAAEVRAAADSLPEETYSTFELATALTHWWFRERRVRRAVLEIGIGGRYDAVNAVPNQLAVILPIEMEHAAMLGGTLASIAAHKAGIIQPNGVAISVQQVPEVEAIIRAEAAAKSATLRFVMGTALVEAVTDFTAEKQRGREGVTNTSGGTPHMASAGTDQPNLPGRLEVIERGSKRIIIDGAHTARSAGRLRVFIEELTGESATVHVIAGMLRDKLPREVLAPFDSPHLRVTLTTAPGHRAIPAAELAAYSGLTAAQVEVVPLLTDALDSINSTRETTQVVMGSLRMAAIARESLGLLSPDELIEAQATRGLFEGAGYLDRLPAGARE